MPILIAFLLIWLVVWLASNSWPISLYWAVVLAVYSLTRQSNRLWLKAMNALLLPVLMGLSVLVIALLGFNLFLKPAETAPISALELFFIKANGCVPPWIRGGWAIVLAIAILALLSVVNEKIRAWRPVTRLVWIQTNARRVAAALGVLTSFSFFTAHVVLPPKSANAERRVTAEYIRLKEAERLRQAEYLAVRATAASVKSASSSDVSYIAGLIRAVDTVPRLTYESKVELARHLGTSHGQSGGRRPGSDDAAIINGDLLPDPVRLRRTPAVLLSEERSAVIEAEGAASEAWKGLRKIISSVIGLGEERLAGYADEFLKGFVATQLDDYRQLAMKYLDKIADKYADKVADRVVERILASREAPVPVQQVHPVPGSVAAEDIVEAAIEELGVRRPIQLADSAIAASDRVTMLARSGRDFGELAEIAVQANIDAHEATRLTKAFGGAVEGVGNVPGRVKQAGTAVNISDRVNRAAKAANEAETAIKRARAAVEVLEAARETRGLAESRESVKDILKILPHL